MRYFLISIEEGSAAHADVRRAFDAALEQCLADRPAATVVIHLRADMAASLDLLEWLEAWTRRFSVVDMQCIIVPQTVAQYESLELSHPEQNLRYVASLAEVEGLYPAPAPVTVVPEASPVDDMAQLERLFPSERTASVPPAVNAAVPARAPEASPPPAPASAVPAPVEQPIVAPPVPVQPEAAVVLECVAIGVLSSRSGEYECRSCGVSRMWLKGEIFSACVNPECMDSDAGWLLTCDLF